NEWRAGFLRERSHLCRGTRECAVRALLASARGEHGVPAWGPEGDPLDGVRLSAVWRGIGGDRPLPHAPLELLRDDLSPPGGAPARCRSGKPLCLGRRQASPPGPSA
ncbi:unnamed protein product, partial [Ectocarpus sp. 13 AM-2016]